MAALLGQVCRGEIHDHALGRHGKAERGQSGPHPLPAFRHGLVTEADNVEIRLPAGQLHLDVNRLGLNSLERECRDAANHAAFPVSGKSVNTG